MLSKEQAMRKALFLPCKTKDQLHKFVKLFLGLDLPNCIVCDDEPKNPSSNTSPTDLLWEMYSHSLDGKDPKYTQFLGFSAREGGKTLNAAIMEVLCLFHLNRDVAHLAALEVQAKICQKYVEKFLNRPILKEFITSKNKRTIEITYFKNNDGDIISPIQYEALLAGEKQPYDSFTNSIQIVICTAAAANGLHVPFMVMDELDLADPEGVEEARMIPVSTEDRKLPITLYTSTRKYSFGQVQKQIDKASETDLQIRHWNIIDVTEACPPERHLPDEPKIPIYYSEDILKAISKEEFDKLSEKDKMSYDLKEGYSGCLKNCKLFAACKGRLATKQKSKSPLLKTIGHTQSVISKVSVETAKAQYLAWKPSAEGLIYPYFSKEKHMLTAAQMAEKLTGEQYPDHYSKLELMALFKHLGAQWHSGLDWGFTHNFAVMTGALVGHILYIVDVIEQSNLEAPEKVELCKARISHLNPSIYPDTAYPADIALFRRNGFKMINFNKDVLAGINAVRERIMPGAGKPPTIFFLKDDVMCELATHKMTQYHWKMDKQSGQLTDQPDKEDDDILDACRYLCQNLKNAKGAFTADAGNMQKQPAFLSNTQEDWMKNKIKELTQDGSPGELSSGSGKGNWWID